MVQFGASGVDDAAKLCAQLRSTAALAWSEKLILSARANVSVATGGRWWKVRSATRGLDRRSQGVTIYENRLGALKPQTGQPKSPSSDLDRSAQSDQEEEPVEKALKIDVPTREETEIEASSRLYQEDGAQYMTATLLFQPEQGEPPHHARHLHPRRPSSRHRALCRAAGLPDLRQRAQKEDAACMRCRGAGGAARGDHRPRGRPRRAHPGRGRQAVADHVRHQGRRAYALTPLRRQPQAIGREGELTSRSRESLPRSTGC